ncbi:AAA family ATPase [Nocardia sp. NPDC058480]|uniref:helix-turn-helix transcriptional regulator n=1 Tax=Nocardia sp. NPDC058480 TaxID=3346522 RepID=UPI003667B722
MTAESFFRAPVLVDRIDELSWLESCLDEAGAGAGHVVLLEGPAGIGKTTVLDELRRRAQVKGWDVRSARGGELERGFGFGVVRQLLEAGLSRAEPRERARLLSGAASLAEAVFTSVDHTAGGDIAFATLHGLYWLVANIAERSPVLITIDDLGWIDEPSLRFLRHLTLRLDGLPALIAVTAGTGGERHRRDVEEFLLEARPSVLRPRPMSLPAVATLLRDRLGAQDQPRLARACLAASGGNPFLLTELLGALHRRDDAGAVDPSTVARLAPRRVAAAVLARVSRIDAAAPGFARAVAVLGDSARVEDCARLVGLDPTAAGVLADALAAVAVLERGEPLRFVHPVVRAAVYGDIPGTERAALHARAADVLAAQGADPTAVAAHLLVSSPSGDQHVVTLLREAAQRAAAAGAPDTAATLLRRALDEPPAAMDHPQLLFELGTAEHEIGARDASLHLRLAGETAVDPVDRARAVIALAWTTHADPVCQRDQIALYERAAVDVGDHDRELALHLEAAKLGALLANPSLPTSFEAEAVRFGTLPAHSAAECLLLSFVARRALATGGPVAEAGDLAEQSAAHPAMTSHGGHPLWRTNITICLVAAERYGIAEDLLTRAARHAARTGSPQWTARVLWLRGLTRHRSGDLRGAETDLRAAVDAQGLTPTHFQHTVFPLIDVLIDQGRLDEAAALLTGNGLDGEFGPEPMAISSRIARGRLRAARGEFASAHNDLVDALHRLTATRGLLPGDHDTRIALVPVLAALGDDPGARELADAALAAATAAQSRRAIGGALRVSGLLRHGAEGLDLLHRAVEILADSPSLVWRAEALLDYGSALRRSGRTTVARPPLRQAMELAHRCGAAGLAERASGELRAAGGRPRRRAGTGVAALTSREHRVAELAARGSSNKEIAQSLFVTLRTVEMHLSSAYLKLGIRSRNELAVALRG